ncbi:MAG: hypothetical protein ACREO5_08945, partial [Candidatus Binatia bacterium]
NNTMVGARADGVAGVTNGTALGFRAQVTQSNSLILGSINGINGSTADTNVGIGTTAPTTRLHVVGDGLFTGNLTINGMLNAPNSTVSATTVVANTQYNIGTDRILSVSGPASTNTIVGILAGNANPAGGDNSFFGNSAGSLNVGGFQNSFFGSSAGFGNTEGGRNAFFGYDAGLSSTTGNDNAYFGARAGQGGSGGNQNSFFGQAAGKVSSGSSNSFFGNNAGCGCQLAAQAGSRNSFFGEDAGSENVDGNDNTFLGNFSGFHNVEGSGNTLLGSNTDVATDSLTNATAVGAGSLVSQSNSIVLGGINGVNGATADTNVGIGTTAPASKLHVNGAVRVTNGSVFVANPNTLIITSPNGACWGITVSNTGALSSFSTPCP